MDILVGILSDFIGFHLQCSYCFSCILKINFSILLIKGIFFFNLEANYVTILWWFFHILTWNSHGCTCVPILHPPRTSPPHSHPSGSSQCTSPECPASCSKPGLVIYFTYDNIYVSMLFSQIIPPSPSPTESNRLFFTSESLLLSHI